MNADRGSATSAAITPRFDVRSRDNGMIGGGSTVSRAVRIHPLGLYCEGRSQQAGRPRELVNLDRLARVRT